MSGVRPLPVLLALLCLALLGVIYEQLDRPAVDQSAVAAPMRVAAPEPSGTPLPAGFALPPLRDYAEVLERPLFSPTRRMPDAAPLAPPRSPSFAIVGIVISAGTRHALVEHGRPARLERIAEGQLIGGWKVESILSDSVVVSYGRLREEVKARDKTQRPARPAPGSVRPGLPDVLEPPEPDENGHAPAREGPGQLRRR